MLEWFFILMLLLWHQILSNLVWCLNSIVLLTVLLRLFLYSLFISFVFGPWLSILHLFIGTPLKYRICWSTQLDSILTAIHIQRTGFFTNFYQFYHCNQFHHFNKFHQFSPISPNFINFHEFNHFHHLHQWTGWTGWKWWTWWKWWKWWNWWK